MIRKIAAVFGVMFGGASVAWSGVPITKIADTSTPVPGSGGTFSSFGIVATDRDDPGLVEAQANVYSFTATTSNGINGIYGYASPQGSYPGGLSVSVDTTMVAPTGEYYSGFPDISEGHQEFGFIADTTSGAQLLMAEATGYPLTVIAQTGISPSAGQTFSSFQSLSVMEGTNTVNQNVMEGEVATNAGIYDFSYFSGTSSFSLVANGGTLPPGTSSTFNSFGSLSYKAGRDGTIPGNQSTIRAVLATVGGAPGIYYGQSGPLLSTSAPLVKLADTTTIVPGGTGSFTSFGNPVATSNEIDFTAHYNTSSGDQQGIFSYGPYLDGSPPINGGNTTAQLTEFLATGDIAPDSDGAHFASFLTLADNEIFTAMLDDGVEGLYEYVLGYYGPHGIYIPPVTYKVLDTSETLGGKSIADIEVSSEASSDTGTGFKVDFTDGSEGLYYFSSVPEPAFFAFPLAIAWFFGCRRR